MKESTEFGKVPNSWGTSELTRFFDHARHNQVMTFIHQKEARLLLEEIDDILMHCAQSISHIKGKLVSPMLVLRCHSAYRAACQLAFAGHNSETFALIRSTLEYAGYSMLMSSDPALEELWVSRHQQEGAIGKIARAFSSTAIDAAIRSKEVWLADIFQSQYQRSIDFGAHPNSHALNSSMRVAEDKDELVTTVMYLHDGDTTQRHALKSLAQSGLCALHILQIAFERRFAELKIKQQIEAVLRKHPV